MPTVIDGRPCRELAKELATLARGVEEQSNASAQALAAEEAQQRREVLFGERLGRRHQNRLMAVLGGAEHRVGRHDGLAAPHLADQQALHRAAVGEVRIDRANGRALI